MPVQRDLNGLEVLDPSECMRLLGSVSLGRIGLSSDALPVVLPVNFVLVGDQIVVRTRRGTKLAAATRNAIVAFEVDQLDPNQAPTTSGTLGNNQITTPNLLTGYKVMTMTPTGSDKASDKIHYNLSMFASTAVANSQAFCGATVTYQYIQQ